jgi:hypothetical protein
MISEFVTDRVPMNIYILSDLSDYVKAFFYSEGHRPGSCLMDIIHYRAFISTQFPSNQVAIDHDEERDTERYKFKGVPVGLGKVKGCVLSDKEIK